jgi:hypothetical protein
MEMSIKNSNIEDCSFYEDATKSKLIQDMELDTSKDNIMALRDIQKIILYYENKVISLDDVLTRVLEFYGKFVPYK